MLPIIDEFKKFALRGNMVDLAIGFTVGSAFTSVVKSLVDNIIMPPVGMILGGVDFTNKFLVLSVPDHVTPPEDGFQSLQSAQEAGVVTLDYGEFLNSCLTLFIVAVVMFALIRGFNRLDEGLDQMIGEEPPQPGEPTEKKCQYCRSTIAYRATRCPHCTSEIEAPSESNA
ncbi:large conductance mechanosensitive channel protein MscL [Thalassoglobus sp. JC818]|uniref:large conductance mechanosensitive channel protein MscL n=1 Tax=Thalassoglobus sp. JC818 TaxID=3232136 RepID=UPI0034592B21